MKLIRIRAFTLPELMVVILILAILMAVAVPIYLAASSRAIDRAAQQRLRNATTAAKNLRSDLDIGYSNQTEAQLEEEAQPISFVIAAGNPPVDSTDVYVDPNNTTADTMSLSTRDANDDIHTATINNQGAVNIN